MRRFKFKPTQFEIEKWIKDCENFKAEIRKLESKYKVYIYINKKVSSIYFTINNVNYRISTHDEGVSNENDLFNWSGFKVADESIRTNSKNNILKHAEKILSKLVVNNCLKFRNHIEKECEYNNCENEHQHKFDCNKCYGWEVTADTSGL